MKEKQSLGMDAMQPSFKAVTGKGGVKVIDGSSVKFGRFDGAEPHRVGNGFGHRAGRQQHCRRFMQWKTPSSLDAELC